MPDPAVYFDTCVFIELLQKTNQERLDACEVLLERAQNGKLWIVTSAITITEVNKITDDPKSAAAESKVILEFFENPYIRIRTVDRLVAEFAHELTHSHGLKNLDAIHVATAVLNKIPVLYTYDLAKNKRRGLLRHNGTIGNPPLRIEMPPDPMKGTLFDPDKLPNVP